MTVRVRWTDGTWKVVNPGKLKVKWGGSSWVTPAMMRIKWGSGWIDTGYRGYPADATGISVYSWDYSQVRIQWSAGAGGAPVSAWHIVQTDQSGNWLREYEVAGSPSPSGYFPVSHSTKYMFYVRAKGTSGLYSVNWNGPLKVSIGKPDASYYTTENATRGWTSGNLYVNGYRDALVGPTVPSSVVVTSVAYQISSQGGFTSVLSPYNNREIYRVGNSGQGERFSWGNPVDYTLNVTDYWGNGGVTGFVCRGIGWSSTVSGVYKAIGYVTVTGTEHYTYQQYHSVPAVANAYW